MSLAPVVDSVGSNPSHPWPPTVENPHRVNNVLSLQLWHSLPENYIRKPFTPQHLRSSRSHLGSCPVPWEVHGCPSMLITLPKMIPCSAAEEERAMARRRQRPVAWVVIVTQLPPSSTLSPSLPSRASKLTSVAYSPSRAIQASPSDILATSLLGLNHWQRWNRTRWSL